MGTVLGVDEAGRGAVLGPLVVAGVCVDEDQLPALLELGARDSKLVVRGRRGALVRAIARSAANLRAVVIPATAVDRENLTVLEREAAVQLITTFAPERVVVDAPVSPAAIPAFAASLCAQAGLPPGSVLVAPKADRDHPAVGAASLLAKVVRDGYVAALRREFGDFGWGYPAEPRVRAYLAGWWASHGTLPSICRTRWGCVQDLVLPKLMPTDGSCAPAKARRE